MAAIGLVWLGSGLTLPLIGGYAVVGPGLFVVAVGGVLVLLGLLLVREVALGEVGAAQAVEDTDVEAPASLPALGLAVAGTASPLLLMKWLGFPLTAATVFVLVAAAFGERRWLRAAALGLLLGHLCYFGFGWLGVGLGGYLPLLGR